MIQAIGGGGGGGGGRGRGRGRGRGNSYRGRGGIRPRETQRFQGREEGLQGHIYDLQAHKSPDQYIRTTHEITTTLGGYIRSTLPSS